MAAGRGEFFRSLLEGLERKPAQPNHGRGTAAGPGRGQSIPGRGQSGPGRGQSGPGRGQSGPGRGQSGPGRGQSGPGRGQSGPGRGQSGPGRGQSGPGKRQTGRRQNKKKQPKASLSSVSGKDGRTQREEEDFPQTFPSKENIMERLPCEILTKILSYLDASSLLCISHVSRLFHSLANDDIMWQKIYMSEFGTRTWRPKSVDNAAPKDDPVEVEDRSAGNWKKLYFRTTAGHEMTKWRRELREYSPYTGLPRQTEWVLRNMNVSWELTVTDCLGREITLEQSRAYFFESSVIICWSEGSFPRYYHIHNIQLHGVRKERLKSPEVRKSAWRSLISKLEVKSQCVRLLGKDKLVRLLHLAPGFIIGIWRGQQSVAFIMASLHFHKLVEKSLLGSPACPYYEPEDLPPADNSDPEFGLHGYSLHFVLHNTGTEIMLGHFRQLSFCTDQISRGLLELRVINKNNLSQHRSLSGNIKLPWKTEFLEGSVENCCIITLTLLDEFQKPFWCVSSPIYITMAKNSPSSNYSGEHFVMEYQNAEDHSC
ncbi:F-box only protein 15-like isoform X3 [Sparus aurata]|uniref:F-box only protein 15-like isoform X3 n=1 Tax=Sparus aurata TaxID=8175 RepID=UPI0011C0E220|nr:F-box only protein 15-like isoform X3 [Sparus aurata]